MTTQEAFTPTVEGESGRGRRGSRGFWKGFAAAYALWATVAGFAMKATIPPLNPLGIAYVGLTSPIMMACIAAHSECGPIPPQQYAQWLFTFSEDGYVVEHRP